VQRPAWGVDDAESMLQACLVFMLGARATSSTHARAVARVILHADRRWVRALRHPDVHQLNKCVSMGVAALSMGAAHFNPAWPLHVHARGGDPMPQEAPGGWSLRNLLCGVRCKACGRTSRHMLRCASCLSVSYCSPSCQAVNWGAHRSMCAPAT